MCNATHVYWYTHVLNLGWFYVTGPWSGIHSSSICEELLAGFSQYMSPVSRVTIVCQRALLVRWFPRLVESSSFYCKLRWDGIRKNFVYHSTRNIFAVKIPSMPVSSAWNDRKDYPEVVYWYMACVVYSLQRILRESIQMTASLRVMS